MIVACLPAARIVIRRYIAAINLGAILSGDTVVGDLGPTTRGQKYFTKLLNERADLWGEPRPGTGVLESPGIEMEELGTAPNSADDDNECLHQLRLEKGLPRFPEPVKLKEKVIPREGTRVSNEVYMKPGNGREEPSSLGAVMVCES